MKGFSLIELLSALTISILGLTMLMSVFVNDSLMHQRYLALADTRNNERFSVYILHQSIQKAGYIGCATLNDDFNIKNSGADKDHALSFSNSLQVYSTHDPARPPLSKLKPNTDVIEIRKMSSEQGQLIYAIDNGNQITLTENPIFKSGDNIIISDCQHAVMSRVRSVFLSKKYHLQRLTLWHAIHGKFDRDAAVGHLERLIFFIKTTNALYEVGANDRPMELTPGVSDLQVFGYVWDDDKNLVIKNLSEIIDWKKVALIHVVLNVQSKQTINHLFSFTTPLIERMGG